MHARGPNASVILETVPIPTSNVAVSTGLDYDGKVDMRDISMAARAFGSYPCHPRYDRGAAKIVDDAPAGWEDELVTMRDIAAVARAFGTTYPLPLP